MNINEKTAYLRGLFDGLNIPKDGDEGKLFAAIIDTLDGMADAINELEAQNDAINDELDLLEEALEELDEDLDDLDEDIEELTEMLDPDYERLYGYDGEEDEEDDVDIDWEDDFYELKCPTCGEEIVVEEGTLAEGSMKCPTCGETLEFDLSELEGGDECECGCGHKHGHKHHHHHHEHGEKEEEKED